MHARINRRPLSFFVMSLVAGVSASCGAAEISSLPALESSPETESEQFFLSDQSQQIEAIQSTLFKTSTAQSSSLAPEQRCSFEQGETRVVSRVVQAAAGHLEVTFGDGLKGCSFKTGFLYAPHVKLKDVFIATAQYDTVFKAQLAQSSDLSASQKCAVPKGKSLTLTKAAEDAGAQHYRIEIPDWELSGCPFGKGYIFGPHFSKVDSGISKGGFEEVMPHILRWEGGCSDHPADTGGRTYMGITEYVARRNGWTADVCTMPKWMVLSIYRADYWDLRAKNYGWPLNLAVMNTEVNSGGGRAQIFIDRMTSQGISGTLREKAKWFVDQQTDFYYRIVASNPSQQVFLRGWVNRSNYMQDVIAGQAGFSLAAPSFEPTAKAYFDDGEE